MRALLRWIVFAVVVGALLRWLRTLFPPQHEPPPSWGSYVEERSKTR